MNVKTMGAILTATVTIVSSIATLVNTVKGNK